MDTVGLYRCKNIYKCINKILFLIKIKENACANVCASNEK